MCFERQCYEIKRNVDAYACPIVKTREATTIRFNIPIHYFLPTYRDAEAEPWFPLLANKLAKNCCTILWSRKNRICLKK